MLRKCLSQVKNQWMGALALFLVLTTGSAYALGGSNTVFSDDIVNGQVKADDVGRDAVGVDELADNSVGAREVRDDSLRGVELRNNGVGSVDLHDNGVWSADVRDDTLPGGGLSAADLGPESVGASEVADSSLGSQDIANGSLVGQDVADDGLSGADVYEPSLSRVPSATLGGMGEWNAASACNPESENYVDCGFNRVNLPEATNVLLMATVRGIGDPGTSGGTGFCRLGSNQGGSLGATTTFQGTGDNTTLMAIIHTGAGVEDYGVECNEYNNGIQYNRINVVTVALSGA